MIRAFTTVICRTNKIDCSPKYRTVNDAFILTELIKSLLSENYTIHRIEMDDKGLIEDERGKAYITWYRVYHIQDS